MASQAVQKLLQSWANQLTKSNLRGPQDHGVSFVHVSCDCATADDTSIAMKAISQKARAAGQSSVFWVFADELASAEFSLPSDLNPLVQVTTCAKIAAMLDKEEEASKLVKSTCVFDTHCGQYSASFLKAVSRMICHLATVPKSDQCATIFVFGHAAITWDEKVLYDLFPGWHDSITCSRLSIRLHATPDEQDPDSSPDMVSCLLKEATRILSLKGERASHPNLVSTMMPLDQCLFLYTHFTTVMSKNPYVEVFLIRKDRLQQDSEAASKALSPTICVIVLVDSSIRFLPKICTKAIKHSCVLPQSVPSAIWDNTRGRIVTAASKVQNCLFFRLGELTRTRPCAARYHSNVPNVDQLSIGLHWTIPESIMWALLSLRRDDDGAWGGFATLPMKYLTATAGTQRESAFFEVIWMLQQRGLVVAPDVGSPDVGILKLSTLDLTQPGRDVANLLHDGVAKTITEAMLIMTARQEQSFNVKLALAAVAAICHVGFGFFMRHPDTVPAYKNTLKHFMEVEVHGMGKPLGSRGRIYLLIGVLNGMTFMSRELDGFEADSFAKVETQMGRILEGRAKLSHLGRELSDDEVLRVEAALVKAMIGNLVMMEPSRHEPPRINIRGIGIGKVEMEPVPFGWADDQQVPSSRCFGVHFGMVKDAITGAYRALAPLIVSTEAVLTAFEGIWPSEQFGGRSRAYLESCIEFLRSPLVDMPKN